ncbi:MAG: hypothetical protein KatS3mg113_1064 [Planctomycetaceae bacterium]|nr:MAG: hypothetical protein KatS3mg113_1064 [Planctomycetaceae bacterium]
MDSPDHNPTAAYEDVPDVRLYVVHPDDWEVRLKTDSTKQYCYQKKPGQDFFHLILKGEIYLAGTDELLCLQCAFRRGIVTQDRLFWQHRVPRRKPPVI